MLVRKIVVERRRMSAFNAACKNSSISEAFACVSATVLPF